MRPKALVKEKHLPLKYVEVGEAGRLHDAIKEQAGTSLRESFDNNLYQNPVWKSVDKKKWRDQRGMSYEG